MDFKILDCTIRDGGHLCNWEFDESCVKASYFAAMRSGVHYFEIGYRNPSIIEGLGPYGYCQDEYLIGLLEPSEDCKLTIMIDAGKASCELINVCDKHNTPIKAIRVAAYPYELEKAITIVEDIKSKGYEVFLNLMACSELKDEEYFLLQKWKNKQILETISFADSFGSFVPKDISYYIEKLKSIGFEKIGFHSHNNLQMAFANTLRAIDDGAAMVDASIFGMGRGAGNLPIEVLLAYIEKNGDSLANVAPYLDVIDRYYQDLHNKYRWGYKLSSLMSGIKNIHPYYVKTLFENEVFSINEIWNALDMVQSKCPISYSKEQLNVTLDNRFYTLLTPERASLIYQELKNELQIIPANDAVDISEFKYENMYEKRKFVIIANGHSIEQYQSQIESFIKELNCVTIGTNDLRQVFKPDFHVFVSRKRFLKHANNIDSGSILLTPTFWGKEIVEKNYNGNYDYYKVECSDSFNKVSLNGFTQQCSNLNVTISAILLAYQMGASDIYVVGMDGYVEESESNKVCFYNEDNTIEDRQVAMVRYKEFTKEVDKLNEFLETHSVNFSIITPTSHKKYYKNVLII